MTNSDIADILKSFADLSELHGGNPFKIKSYAAASFRIDKLHEPLEGKTLAELEAIEGIGKSIAKIVFEINTTNTFPELIDLLNATPEGVRQLMKIKGIGPKKVALIWKEMAIENIGELLYACKENRLAQMKGFGLKTQDNIIKQIEFMYSSAGKVHYARAYPVALKAISMLTEFETVASVSLCGDIGCKAEILTAIDLLIATDNEMEFAEEWNHFTGEDLIENRFREEGFDIHLHFCQPGDFGGTMVELTANPVHLEKLSARLPGGFRGIETEQDVYKKAGLPFVVPELRNGRNELELASEGKLPELIKYTDLRGPLHNHSDWSDGLHTIETMAKWCMENGYEYLGMADHSKSAFYANGLNEERVAKQQEEINKLNEKLSGKFRIFSGIECDILYDGNLDYQDETLKTFDYVVASVHSILKMSEEKAMERLIKAIENPYTTILGHPTGRLLLMREGYPVNHTMLIDACAANEVIIELNANPYRLDLDWRYISYALNKGVKISINPDAHEVEGFKDMFWGTEVARKGGLTKEMCFNAQTTAELETWFKYKRK